MSGRHRPWKLTGWLIRIRRATIYPAWYEAMCLENGTDLVELIGHLANVFSKECAEIRDEDSVRPDNIGVALSYMNCPAVQATVARKKGDHKLTCFFEGSLRKS